MPLFNNHDTKDKFEKHHKSGNIAHTQTTDYSRTVANRQKVININLFNINSPTTVGETYDPETEALSIIYEAQESEFGVFESFVYSTYIMETNNTPDIIMESAMDILDRIVTAIKKFIDSIKEFFKKVFLFIASLWMDLGKLASEVKKVIDDKKIDFTIDGYKFTVKDASGPNMQEFQDLVSEYNTDMEDISKLKESEVKKRLQDWLEESNVSKVRGQVLGENSPIEEDDFLDAIRKKYRDGADTVSEIQVDRSMVDTIISGAKELEKVKKEATKDRDTLLTLLEKTQRFFDRTLPTMYKGSSLQADVGSIDVANNKFSKETKYVDASSDRVKVLNIYTSLKYKQINKIASIINLVAAERVNALKDQIKQERTILRRCLFEADDSGKPEKIEDSYIPEMIDIPGIYEGRTYESYFMEDSILRHRLYDKVMAQCLIMEAQLLIQSVNSGEVQIMEADDVKAEQGVLSRIGSAIAKIIDAIIGIFRKKAADLAEKYGPWLEELDEASLKTKAAKIGGLEITDFAPLSATSELRGKIKSAISKAYNTNLKTKEQLEKYDWAKEIISKFDSLEAMKKDNARDIMLNFFRFGKDVDGLQRTTIGGEKLAAKVSELLTYCRDYKAKVADPCSEISTAIKTASDKFVATESLTSGFVLSLLGRPICETELALCTNYGEIFGSITESSGRTIILEAKNTRKPKTKPEASPNPTTTQAQKASGNTGASDANQNAEQVASTVTPEEKKEEPKPTDVKNVQAEKDEAAKKAVSEAKSEYRKNTDAFFKDLISQYLKAREEQFMAYINILAEIDGEKPKFENGKYVPKKKESAEGTSKVEKTKEKEKK